MTGDLSWLIAPPDPILVPVDVDSSTLLAGRPYLHVAFEPEDSKFGKEAFDKWVISQWHLALMNMENIVRTTVLVADQQEGVRMGGFQVKPHLITAADRDRLYGLGVGCMYWYQPLGNEAVLLAGWDYLPGVPYRLMDVMTLISLANVVFRVDADCMPSTLKAIRGIFLNEALNGALSALQVNRREVVGLQYKHCDYSIRLSLGALGFIYDYQCRVHQMTPELEAIVSALGLSHALSRPPVMQNRG